MTVADALPRLQQVCLLGATHADYDLTVARATLYRRLATGEIEPLMRRMARRESEEDYQARLTLTTQTVSSSWAQLRTQFYTVARLRGGSVTLRLDYDEAIAATEATRRAERLKGVLNQYYQRQPVEHYLAERLTKSHCMSDPNAWLLTDFAPFDYRTQVAQPYPLLIPCEAAVDFSRSAGVVQQFTARFSIEQSASRFRYTCYLENEAIDCWPVLRDGATLVSTMPEGSTVAGVFVDDKEEPVYEYRILANKPGRVPAQVLGYVVDEEGSGETFVSPLHAAVPFLLQMLKVGSENDIVMSQMAFPIRLAYVPKCPGAGNINGIIHGCTNGLDIKAADGLCSVCRGTGTVPIPITAAETLALPIPEPGEELKVKAEDLLHFVSPPTDNPKLQLDYLQSRRVLAREAVYGVSDAERAAGTPETATLRRIQQENERVALSPFADWFNGTYVQVGMVCAAYTDTAQGLTITRETPADLELTDEEDLYAKRKAAVDAGADASALEAIDSEIAYKQFSDDEAALVKNKVKRRFITFLGYSNADFFLMCASGYVSPADRVARTHADIIFGELEVANPNFYQLADAEQSRLVAEKIEGILAKLPSQGVVSTFRPPSFAASAA